MPGEHKCGRCGKEFESGRALGGHAALHKRTDMLLANAGVAAKGGPTINLAPQPSPLTLAPGATASITLSSEHPVAAAEAVTQGVATPAADVDPPAPPAHADPLTTAAPPAAAISGGPLPDEPPEDVLNQFMNEADRQRCRDNWKAMLAQRRGSTTPPKTEVVYQPPAQQPQVRTIVKYVDRETGEELEPADPNSPPGVPPPPKGDGIIGLVKMGMQMFSDWRKESKAASLAAAAGPSEWETAGRAAFQQFLQGMSTAQGKATGQAIGKGLQYDMTHPTPQVGYAPQRDDTALFEYIGRKEEQDKAIAEQLHSLRMQLKTSKPDAGENEEHYTHE